MDIQMKNMGYRITMRGHHFRLWDGYEYPTPIFFTGSFSVFTPGMPTQATLTQCIQAGLNRFRFALKKMFGLVQAICWWQEITFDHQGGENQPAGF